MRPLPPQKSSALREREERLRRSHAAAQTLRAVSPRATQVTVHLRFLPESAPPHAAQSFMLYPGARAFFSYRCPRGDCDGIYDLSAAASRALGPEPCEVTGTLECCGLRFRDSPQQQACGLRVSYTIKAQYEAEHASD